MIDFKICYPDANNFHKVIKLKQLKDWNVEYVKLDHDIGYWIADLPFLDSQLEIYKNLIAAFPVQKDNNHPDNVDPNPFDTIHVPEWVSKDICYLLRDFYVANVTNNIYDPQIHEWGNVYIKERSRPITCWRIPHIDYVHGIVANMWFTDHNIKDSSTKLYKYTGKMHREIYDFQVDENHKMHKEWKSMAESPTRANAWFNIPDEELKRWGFELAGAVPTQAGTMTMYNANISHLAYVSESVDFRWSHAFAFSHELAQDTYIRDIFK
jgi:hypothetical protein